MIKQADLINSSDWNCLIILDACRYDYFERVYEKYIDGQLKKVYSEGICTRDWLQKTFENKYFVDTVYVSANPYVNSKGVDIIRFDGSKHFEKIIDVWESGWDDDLKTVPKKSWGNYSFD